MSRIFFSYSIIMDKVLSSHIQAFRFQIERLNLRSWVVVSRGTSTGNWNS